jgi:hypothetical protein
LMRKPNRFLKDAVMSPEKKAPNLIDISRHNG